MNSKKNIILYNSVKRFRDGFELGCDNNDIKLTKVRTRYLAIHLKNGSPARFIYKNDDLDVDNAFNFIQMRGKEAHIPSLIALYCEYQGIGFNDVVNTHHTDNAYKISQMMMLWLSGLPIPETMILSNFSYEANREYIKDHLQFPLVLKKNGDRGEEVWKIKNIEELDKRMILTEIEKKEAIKGKTIDTAILQQCIPNTHDFRVTMFEGDVLGVIKRTSQDGFYNNWSKGALWEPSEISDEEKELSQKACDACGVDLGGVDFVRTKDGILFFEVNKTPQINVNYPEVIVKMLNDSYLV
ncbi:MAG: hypothetical protein ABH826_05485 [Patescibacteria group bacterium]|nr:hypothetical protein [Patescibacteria group bacterium]